MKTAKLFLANGDHQHQHRTWVAEGFKKVGWDVRYPADDNDVSTDLLVMWGWRRPDLVEKAEQAGIPIMVLERGHLHPRMEWTSIGFNGLGGMGTYCPAMDAGERFQKHWGHLVKEWKAEDGRVLVMGQRNGDASLHGLDFWSWARMTCWGYAERGFDVVYRPHPGANPFDIPSGIWGEAGVPIEEALERSSLCVTYTSTSGVEAALSGVPVVTCHPGAMARPVSSHGVMADPVRPPREAWMRDLAWTQFTPEEIRNGFALDCVLPVISTLK